MNDIRPFQGISSVSHRTYKVLNVAIITTVENLSMSFAAQLSWENNSHTIIITTVNISTAVFWSVITYVTRMKIQQEFVIVTFDLFARNGSVSYIRE